MRGVAAAAAIAAMAFVSACGGSSGDADTPTAFAIPTSRTSAAATPTRETTAAGCASPLPEGYAAGEVSVRTLQDGPWERSIRVYVPSSYRAGEPVPLVLNLHGLGSDAEQQEAYSGLVAVAEREGFMLVTPDGSGNTRGWNTLDVPGGASGDVTFVAALLDGLERGFCVDTGRMFAAGFSNGGFMSALLGCSVGDRLTAVAGVAGIYFPEAVECGSGVPVLAIHGTADEVVQFEPGQVIGGEPQPGIRAEMAAWAEHNGCAGTPAREALAGAVTREAYECPSGVDVELVLVDGGGHAWPGAEGVGGDISAAEEIWAFFEAHAR